MLEERVVSVDLGKLVNSMQAMSNLLSQKLPVKLAYWLSRNAKLIAAELELLDEARGKLLDGCGEKNDKGNFVLIEGGQVKLKEDKIAEFWQAYNELLKCTVEMKLKIVKVDQLDGASITPADLLSLDFMVEE